MAERSSESCKATQMAAESNNSSDLLTVLDQFISTRRPPFRPLPRAMPESSENEESGKSSDLLSRLPDEIITKIFKKVRDPITLANCSVISKRFGPILRLASLPYLPCTRIPLRIREDPYLVERREEERQGRRPPRESLTSSLQRHLYTKPSSFKIFEDTGLSGVLESFLSSAGKGVLSLMPPPGTLEIGISFPDRPVSPDHGVLVKWRGEFSSRDHFYFAFAFADDVHPSDLPPLGPSPLGPGATMFKTFARQHFTNFVRMAEMIKNGGDWFHPVGKVVISYSRRTGDAYLIGESFPEFGFTREDRPIRSSRGRAWPIGLLRDIHGMNFQGFFVVFIKGRLNDAFADDQLSCDAFADDQMVYDAVKQSIASMPPLVYEL